MCEEVRIPMKAFDLGETDQRFCIAPIPVTAPNIAQQISRNFYPY